MEPEVCDQRELDIAREQQLGIKGSNTPVKDRDENLHGCGHNAEAILQCEKGGAQGKVASNANDKGK